MNPFFQKIARYLNPLYLFKKEGGDMNLRFMHGINKISFLMFLICIVVMAIRHFKR
jgi:Ni,Fe-hydrogenase I cytochrome b subunit